ncbi:MAG: sulfatase-like hydrolase/transferase [Alphaproteobacteria bacterium]|nr:sulfatase-like hydrolase/transferase [Alphaproteobacteria bacterium]
MLLLALLGCPRPDPTPVPDTDTDAVLPTGETAVPEPPNLLLFLIDDVGPERFAMYDLGSEAIADTPVIDALAAEGVVFERAYATPLCSSTRAALLTSRLAFRTGVGTAIQPEAAEELPEDELTMAEALKASPRGWSTAAFGKWHLSGRGMQGWESHPNRQGFDHYDGTAQNLTGYGLWIRTTDGASDWSPTYHTRTMTDELVAWLADAPEPWFAYVPFACAHAPWHNPPADMLYTPVVPPADDSRRLDAMIETIDLSIGTVLASLSPEARAKTYIVVAGDNGTPHEVVRPPGDPSAAKGSIGEGGIRVPLLVAGPGIEPGRTEALASVMDIWPTLFDLAHEPMPGDRAIDGLSLAPVLADPSGAVRELLYIDTALNVPVPTYEERQQTVISATHKLVVDRGAPPTLHSLTQGFLEGPDLLAGPLDPADQAAWDALFAEYQRMEALTQAEWAR